MRKEENMFNFSLDKRTITIILVVMLGLWLASNGTAGILNLLFIVNPFGVKKFEDLTNF